MMQHNSVITSFTKGGISENPHTKVVFGYINDVPRFTPTYDGSHCYLTVDVLNQPAKVLTLDVQNLKHLECKFRELNFNASGYIYLLCRVDDLFHIQTWQLFISPLMLWELQPILNSSYDIQDFGQLMEIGSSLNSPYFHQFFWQCISDLEFSKKFVSIPASKAHHHDYPGGLVKHSIECFQVVKSNISLVGDISLNEKEATLLAALFHDVGKIKTLNLNDHTPIGKIVNHEQFTLSVIAAPLNYLESVWQQGAAALQYLLTWTEKQGFCKFVGGNLFKLADHISVSNDLRRKAFMDKPSHYVYAAIQAGQNKHFVNRLN